MTEIRGIRAMVIACAALIAGCGGGGDSADTASVPGQSYPLHIATSNSSQYLCGPVGQTTLEVMRDLNGFWGSNVTACSCQFDAPSICRGGAFVGGDPGYIFYDTAALMRLDQITGSRLPADMVMAHEFGHSIQGALGLQTPGKFKELQADCLAGFYVGSRVRRGLATQADVANTFNVACSYGDPYLAPWYLPGSHGVCQERVSALNQGISGNLAGATPSQACP